MLCLSVPSSVTALRGISLSHYSCLLSLVCRRRDAFRQLLDSSHQFHGSNPNYAFKRCSIRPQREGLTYGLIEELEKCPDGSSIRDDGRYCKWQVDCPLYDL
jgi:hypothetical protein